MISKDLNDADPELGLIYAEAKWAWKKDYPNGPWPEVGETYRSNDVQTAYYAQGRQPLKEVNRLRKLAGLGATSATENRRKITSLRAGQSKHNAYPSEALDVWMRLYVVNKQGKRVPGEFTWQNKYYIAFGGYMIAAYRRLKAEGKVKKKYRWGHDWNGDGIANESWTDDPHHEIG